MVTNPFPIVLYTAVQSEGAALSHASDFDPLRFEADFDIMVFVFARQYRCRYKVPK